MDGTSLHQYAWSIATRGGARFSLPPVRGENYKTAYRPGTRFRPKVPDEREITLVMWVTGLDPTQAENNYSSSYDRSIQVMDNLRSLQKLFWPPDTTKTLTRRWFSGNPSPTLLTASTEVEIVGIMEPEFTGPHRANFMVDLMAPDPFFYGTQQTLSSLALDTPTAVINTGDNYTTGKGVEIIFTDQLSNPVLTNQTNGSWVKLGVDVAGGDFVTLDGDSYTAIRDSDSTNLIAAVSHSGDNQWLRLEPGSNTLELTAASGTGTVTVKWSAPYV